MPSPSLTAQGSGSSVSTSTFDADDNDLAPNTVPQTPNVVVQQPKPVEQQVVVAQTVPQVVNVQKIKVRRPRPPTVCILPYSHLAYCFGPFKKDLNAIRRALVFSRIARIGKKVPK